MKQDETSQKLLCYQGVNYLVKLIVVAHVYVKQCEQVCQLSSCSELSMAADK